MAKPVEQITLGIDVAKAQLVICNRSDGTTFSLENRLSAIIDYLRGLTGPVRIAVEPTSNYHFTVVEQALKLGYAVYLVNPHQLVHYRQAVKVRNKTDPQDAYLLARYLEHEAGELRPYRPQDPRAQRLWALLSRRATVIKSRQQLKQSFHEVAFSIGALMTQFKQLLARLEQQIQRLIRDLGWWRDYQCCLSIPGIGPGNAAALTATYHRGAFSGSDAFIAFIGLDVRLRESGRCRGQSKLTKRGAPELRRLLYCASHQARQCQRFADYYRHQRDKGYSRIASRVALSRKLARIAFTLMRNQETFIE